jgi:transcriptional regulator with XRE-family HTH domain
MLAIMNTDKDQFAWVEWLIKEREEQGLSQADLARKTGLTRTTISDYERRQRANPDIEALWKISTALGYPDDFLPRLAGLLPPAEGVDKNAVRIAHESRDLSQQDKEELLAFIHMKKNLRKRK